MKDFLHNTWKHRAHVIMALPVFLVLFFIMYVPMVGLEMAFKAFVNDPLVTVSATDARKLFDEMIENTQNYLGEYFK